MVNAILDNIERNSQIKACEGDYIQDGLMYCGKCHTPKQTRLELMGVVRTPFCLCKCMTEERNRLDQEHDKEEKSAEIDRLRRTAFSESNMHKWNFDNDDGKHPKETSIAKKYVENFDKMKSKGIIFYGTVGTGKTYLACCIANALIDRGIPCLVTNFARLVNTISGMRDGKQEYLDSLSRYRLLVIDDLSAERNTDYMNEIVWNIIDQRYRLGLPLICTTNLSAAELSEPTDLSKQRIYSRVLEMCIPIAVNGEDRRKEKMRQNYKDMQEVLGL